MVEFLVGISPALLIGLLFGYHWNLSKAISQLPPEDRSISGRSVWLGLLPFVGLIVHLRASRQLSRAIRARCLEGNIWHYGPLIEFVGTIASFFVGSATLPFVGLQLVLYGTPVWIFYWIIVSHYQRVFVAQSELRDVRGTRSALIGDAGIEPPVVGEMPVARESFALHRKIAAESLRISLFRISLLLWTGAAALFVVMHCRHSIWKHSNLWTEPVATIRALEAQRSLYRNATLLLIPGVLLCWVWSSNRKKVILFLRRFRQDDVNRVVQHAIRSTMSREFRLLTLDDATFHPITSSRAMRIAAVLAVMIACAALYLTVPIVRIYLNDGLAGIAQAEGLLQQDSIQLFVFPSLDSRLFEDSPIQAVLKSYADVLGILMACLGSFGTLYLGIGLSLAVLGAVYVTALVRVRLNGRSRVRDTKTLKRFTKYAMRLKGRLHSPAIMAPPAAVIAVDTPLWQEAVLSLAGTADLVLFDLSDYTRNIEWEIEQMLVHHYDKCVFIAQGPRLRERTHDTQQGQAHTAAELGGSGRFSDPIVYENPESLDLPHLMRALKSRLHCVRK